ncbi:MAG TPA: sulfatase-like hydrolase/transferase [Thermoanaerobaculia bacterium]|nr:sulfatase-like hydrolase/transferase [Thermoanaerobaculia bacterium]
MLPNGQRPNFLIILVDEDRYPPPFETQEIRQFRAEQLKGQNAIRANGVELHRHYAAATACAPSRTSLFTGQYPSLHGVTQTDGVYKQPEDPDMFWLLPHDVPTMGDYFRAAGYRTFYKGKWHVTHADLIDPQSGDPLPSVDECGQPIRENVEAYLAANPLNDYGFAEWVGPEPHGSSKFNTGLHRDADFARQVLELLDRLEAEHRAGTAAEPWLLVASFVNPHDIVLFGLLWRSFGFDFAYDTVPEVPNPPTRHEDLSTKPQAQKSYADKYGAFLLPQPTLPIYRRFYYYLQKAVDAHVAAVYERLRNSPFSENTVVIFTSDHGDMLGAHGGMHQKWHSAYEEAIHVPLVIANPILGHGPCSHVLSSHVDLLPTMLGLAGLDAVRLGEILKRDHTATRPLVGRDLSPILRGGAMADQPLFFMTDDEISEGQGHRRPRDSGPVVQPNHIETVLATGPTKNGRGAWKYTRYFDNPDFWTVPNERDEVQQGQETVGRTQPLPDEFELYDLGADPTEERNLAHPSNSSEESRRIQEEMQDILESQRAAKRLAP